MKIHPAPKKPHITIRYDVASTTNPKKLRRLPHIFAKVLELPFSSDADVIIDETPHSLRFIVPTDSEEAFDARTIEIYPGVTKIVIIGGSGGGDLGEIGIDVWRFRLPGCTVPELASAVYRDGELVVTVPKGGEEEEEEEGVVGAGHGQLLIVH